MEQSFHKPTSVDDAVKLLADHGEQARLLAGGATLVALSNAALVEPSALISLSAIEELNEVRHDSDGSVRIGAMRRHRQTAFETPLQGAQRVLSNAARQIANVPVRNMGTLGGSIAFADPAADYPPALVAADARIELASSEGRREVSAEDFFEGWYETAIEEGEMVTAVILPSSPGDAVGHYQKLARISGDFAIASVALCVAQSQGSWSSMRIAIGGCGGGPVRVADAEASLLGKAVSDTAVMARAGEQLVAALDPVDDVRASAEYRLRVAPRLLTKALTMAAKASAS